MERKSVFLVRKILLSLASSARKSSLTRWLNTHSSIRPAQNPEFPLWHASCKTPKRADALHFMDTIRGQFRRPLSIEPHRMARIQKHMLPRKSLFLRWLWHEPLSGLWMLAAYLRQELSRWHTRLLEYQRDFSFSAIHPHPSVGWSIHPCVAQGAMPNLDELREKWTMAVP